MNGIHAGQRRLFLKLAGGSVGMLVLGVYLPFGAHAAAGASVKPAAPRPNVFIRIAANDTVTVICKHQDMGQGTVTGLATLVAEELDADWAQMRYEYAPADAKTFGNHLLGVQGVGQSTSMANSWDELRKAGAAARAMLVAAAAQQWGVPVDSVTVSQGRITHAASGRSSGFGPLAQVAAALPVPQQVVLKEPAQFKLIGTQRPHRLDNVAKTSGKEVFGLDVRLPGMRYAVLARPPRFGAVMKSFDASAARKVPRVLDVVATPYGVAVLASNTWSAIQGRAALKIEWDDTAAERRSSPAMAEQFRQLAAQPGTPAGAQGDVAAVLPAAAKRIDADYEFPYLAHVALEPLNATIEFTATGATLHTGCQFQTIDQLSVAQELGLKPEQVRVRTLMAGGSFGRRANPAGDYVRHAAAVAKAAGGKLPVQLVWTRSDDLAGGYYRSMFLHRVSAGLDAGGELVAWDHRIVGHSIGEGTALERYLIKDSVDFTSVEGAAENTYGVSNFRCQLHSPTKTVPVLWWRSVGHAHSAYVVETLIDEAAFVAGRDPLAYRLARLSTQPRLAAVLKLAADKSGWGGALPKGRGRGIAGHASFGGFVAHVAELSVDGSGRIKVERIVCAVDCGLAVNPNVIAAQVEGGVAFALSALLFQAVTFKDGIVEQNNFDAYPMLRLAQMPHVEVHIVPSTEPPSGIGEPVIPTVGPAVANALFSATGQRVRKLPFAAGGFSA
jgi:isoquinoline 1-oxidoreductase subunit beta